MTLRVQPPEDVAGVIADPSQPVEILLRHLRAGREGLSTLETHRRLVRFGPNTLTRRQRRAWPRELVEQVAHPLALLLEAAGVLAFVAGMAVLGWAIFAVVLLNAVFAFWQERQAERAVETLRAYLPQHAAVLRDGVVTTVEASTLVPGDVLVLAEGQRVSADARMIDGDRCRNGSSASAAPSRSRCERSPG